MTRLFNLESYTEYCQYTILFQNSPVQLVDESRELYRFLLERYASKHYLLAPIINSNRSSQLTINPHKLDYLSAGIELTQGEKQRLFIISDTLDLMTLTTSNILGRGDAYLYNSAYHYWNHYIEINQYSMMKPLVFVDLDSFGISTLIPIRFSRPENSPYQVPILNTKDQIVLDRAYDCREIYKNIIQSIAKYILRKFPALSENNQTVNHLFAYLQKINFLQLLQPYIDHECIDLIVEIYQNKQIFYKQVSLSMFEIAHLVCREINFSYLQQIANNHPQYKFVLVSQYNIFDQIRSSLRNFIFLNPSQLYFQEIWTQNNNSHFPLFAIYLDNIEFAIAINSQKEWIKLSQEENAISYEGKPTILIGNIPSLAQNFLRIKQGKSSVNLPIRVNGKDYCINNVPQDYKIQIENYQGTEEICIQIQFNLQPGSFPELTVRDLNDIYKIKTTLINRQQTYYSYIPPEKIVENRQQQSLSQIQRLKIRKEDFQSFRNYLTEISTKLDKIIHKRYALINYESIIISINSAYEKIHRPDLLQFIDTRSTDSVVIELITELQNGHLYRITNIVNDLLTSNQISNNQIVNFLVRVIILTGKLYQFSQYIFPEKLFHQLQCNNAIKINSLSNEYLQCLARIALSQEYQQKYFSLFSSLYNSETTQYMWGYGNILLWYYDFSSSVLFLDYQEHFQKIATYLLTKDYTRFSEQYKKYAFFSLIYLLTFRVHNPEFCQENSPEFLLAQKVIQHFRLDTIRLRAGSQDKSLNQYFQELIENSLGQDDIDNLPQG